MRPNYIKTPEEVANFRESLNNWVNKGSSHENRIEAADRITDAFETDNEYLGLNYLRLTSLPFEITKLTHLKSLFLSKNNLNSIPEEVLLLTQLHSLDLHSNNITSLPEGIKDLTQLQYLDLSRNQLTSIREEVWQLTQLDTLDFKQNQLSEIPPRIRELTKLDTLDFDNNQISEIPKEIIELTNLKFLGFSNNQISEIPQEIGNLTQLEYLYLDNNQLTSAIEEIRNLTRLIEIDLRKNQLTSLTEDILTAQYQNDVTIHLEHNLVRAEENIRLNEIISRRNDNRVTLTSSIYQEATIMAENTDVLAEILKKIESEEEKKDISNFFHSTSEEFQTFIRQCNRMRGWEVKPDEMAVSLLEIIKKMKESDEKGGIRKILCENSASFSSTSCEDRVALDFALMNIKILFPDEEITKLTFKEIFEASKPQAICAALLKSAEEKIKLLKTQGGLLDEIEVYLAYLENVKTDFEIDLGPVYGKYTGGENSSINCARVSENDIQTINNEIREIGIDRLTSDYIVKDPELHNHPEVKKIIDEIGNREEFDTLTLKDESEKEYLDRLNQISIKRPQALHQAMLNQLQPIIEEEENYSLENDVESIIPATQPLTQESSLCERPRTSLYSRFVSIFNRTQPILPEEIPSPNVPPQQSLLQRLIGNNISGNKK